MFRKKYKVLRNRQHRNQGLVKIAFAVVLLALSGCAGQQIPDALPLNSLQQQDALILLQQIRQRDCPDTLDADLRISWKGYGQNRTVNATLQATSFGKIRLSGLDPLGRPFFILSAQDAEKESSFVLVNNLQGRAYTGRMDSDFIQKYIPIDLSLTSLFSFLTAQLPQTVLTDMHLVTAEGNDLYWFIFAEKENMTVQAGVDPESGHLQRQMLVDASAAVLLDVDYGAYQLPQNDCVFPLQLSVRGEKVTGSLEVFLQKIYPDTSVPDEIFRLQIPEHFTTMKVQ